MKKKLLRLFAMVSKYTLYGTLLQLAFLSFVLASESEAQSIKSITKAEIEVEFSESSLLEVFQQIEYLTDYEFVYFSPDIKKLDKSFNLKRQKVTVSDLLLEISENYKLSFRQVNNSITVKRENSETNQRKKIEIIIDGITITGKVTSEDSPDGLPGVNVIVKGTSQGTVTDINGNYQIEVPSEESVLVFSSVGFIPEEVGVGSQTVININMTPDITSLSEVVVIGYGTQRKEEITSAVSSVQAEEFVTGNTRDVAQLIQGKVAGLTVANPSGDPTTGTSIRLRGNTTLVGADQTPLVIIDGIPGALNTVAPEDIQSVDVLKDGSAAAIYGVRGNNGVILITTKRGGGDVLSINYSSSVSVQEITREVELLTAEDYRGQIEAGDRDASFDLGSETNWLDEITRTPVSQIHNLTLRGGNTKTNYIANVNYRGLQGIMLKSNNNTFTGRIEVNHKMWENKVQINAGILNWYNKINTTADGGSFNSDAYQQSLRYNPTAPVYNDDGSYYENIGFFNYANPVALLKEADGRNASQNTRLYGSVSLFPIKGLELKALGSINNYNQDRGYYETRQHISTTRNSRNGYASVGGVESVERLLDLTANYEADFGQHNLNVLAGYSYQDLDRSEHWMQNWDFPSDRFDYHRIQLGRALAEGEANMFSDRYKWNLIGFFGRVNYSFNNKYLAMVSVRHEGASQLWGAENPWGTFPAASVGWRVTEETFMDGSSFVNDLKLRVGYGVTGSRPSNLTLGVPILAYTGNFYYDGRWIQTLAPTQNPNPNLKWEEKHELNFGLDFAIMDSRIDGSIDYYIRNTQDLLYDYPVPVPPNLVPSLRTNAAEINNSGLEVALNFHAVNKEDFQWTSTVLFSTNKSELVSLGSGVYQTEGDSVLWNLGGLGEPLNNFATHILEEGEPIGSFYGWKAVDITEDGQWIYENREGERVEDVDTDDYQVLGNGLPNFYAGWNNQIKYKNFDFSVTMRGAFDYQILNATRVFFENPTIQEYNRLKSSQDLVFGKAKLDEPLEHNSYYIEDGDFWKIDNITLGYTFPDISPAIKSFRVYVSTLNTFIITNYSGIDPEVGQLGLAPGIDNRFKYPTTRTYTVGLDLSF